MGKKISQMEVIEESSLAKFIEVAAISEETQVISTNISTLASDNSLNWASGNWISAGFAVGDTVHAVGFTNIGNQFRSGKITALTATKLTIGGADGDHLINESVGSAIIVSKWVTGYLDLPPPGDVVAPSSSVIGNIAHFDDTNGKLIGDYGFAISNDPTFSGLDESLTVPTASAMKLISGTIVQVVNIQTGALSTGTTVVPIDDSIPQNNEGNEYMTLSITPKSSTNKLKIEIIAHLSNQAAAPWWMVAALFQDSTSNSLACGTSVGSHADATVEVRFTHIMTAGTTSSTTFKVRAGANGVGTTTFNGRIGARLYGGSLASSITITEFIP